MAFASVLRRVPHARLAAPLRTTRPLASKAAVLAEPSPAIFASAGTETIDVNAINNVIHAAKPEFQAELKPAEPAAYTQLPGPRTFFVEHGVSVLSLTSNRRLDATQFLSGVFRTVVEHGVEADMVASSVSSVALAFKRPASGPTGLTERVSALAAALEPVGVVSNFSQGHALIECETRGCTDEGTCEFQSEIYRVFAAHGIQSHLFMSQARRRDEEHTLLRVVVHEEDVERAVAQLVNSELFVPA
mmetsp:Transcript_16802/g.32763  ORF Transcript_16802/g.32763 Transcript_16802/m.32763 type:complete len:246 (+) Transcript_16802:115-852(+)|eukprot:CAMPEP_0171502296 /NCGR_PEP_ID=MMETSP0958-20121227/10088_1 /TAXON_ID=87120 /ORGANISM="Aurantiochytrium limacinum, Strain ATCCMYA-1381" /LENGTH=245 /DNA_ID=CAMNT_0012037313 /DNA_START=120 /DNA_END=857 /DNA_ORIENTATION=+